MALTGGQVAAALAHQAALSVAAQTAAAAAAAVAASTVVGTYTNDVTVRFVASVDIERGRAARGSRERTARSGR